MRGADEQPGSMFSYVSLEERVPPDHPLRAIRRITDRALERLSPRFGTLYVQFRPPVDSAREAVARAAAASPLHDPQRAAADGATRLQPAVSLVRGPRDGRRRVVADDVHEESRSAAGRRHRGRVLRRGRDSRRHASGCCPTSISPWTARCSRPGRVTRAFGAGRGAAQRGWRQSDRGFPSAAPHE